MTLSLKLGSPGQDSDDAPDGKWVCEQERWIRVKGAILGWMLEYLMLCPTSEWYTTSPLAAGEPGTASLRDWGLRQLFWAIKWIFWNESQQGWGLNSDMIHQAAFGGRMEGLGAQEPTSQGTNKPETPFLGPLPFLSLRGCFQVLSSWPLCPTAFGWCQWAFCVPTSEGKFPGVGEWTLL